MVASGLKAIYLSGWQVAADANTAGQTYPDQSLYPADSVPKVVAKINNAFQRQDQVRPAEQPLQCLVAFQRVQYAVCECEQHPDIICLSSLSLYFRFGGEWKRMT